MTVTLSIKNVPDDLARRLKERAARNHRSLQGELMAIIEDATRQPPTTIREFGQFIDRLGNQHAERIYQVDTRRPR